MTVVNTGCSIFYDNLVADEAKELAKHKKKNQSERKKSVKDKHVEPKGEDGEHQCVYITQIRSNNPPRFLWSESQPVIESGILDRITMFERTLQEAKFEIITTEVTYLNCLNELTTRYMGSKELIDLCTPEQWQDLFGNITVVKAASELVLSDLVQHWHEDIMLTNIYTVLRQHSISILRVYKEYCRNQLSAQELLTELMKNVTWKTTLKRIEQENQQNNSLLSYLSLPMQRVTRLPLLLEAIVSRLQEGTNEYTACKLAISALKKLAKECNESVGKEEEDPFLFLINKNPTKEKTKDRTKARPASWTSYTSWDI